MPPGNSSFPRTGPDPDGPLANDAPAEAFSLLGDETRLRILFALHDPSTETPIEFSRLYEQIEAEFTSGFNYHLDKLVPKFVTKNEDGYALTTFGRRVARAVAAGTFTDHREIDPFEIDGRCVVCDDRSLEASFQAETFVVECRSCEEQIIRIQPPPNLVSDYSDDALVDAVDHWMHDWMQMTVSLARHGICDYCGGPVESSIVDDVELYDRLEVLLRFECTDCGEIRRSAVGALASQHPDVKRFHHKRDTSVRDRRYWEIEQWITDDYMEIVSTDPWCFEVSFYAEGDACTVTVTDGFEVVNVTIE